MVPEELGPLRRFRDPRRRFDRVVGGALSDAIVDALLERAAAAKPEAVWEAAGEARATVP